MGNYNTEAERFRDLQEQAERDMKHAENLKLLSEYCHVPRDKVMEFIRSRRPTHIIRLDGPDSGKVEVRSSDFKGAPAGLTDPELAEWAVQKISS